MGNLKITYVVHFCGSHCIVQGEHFSIESNSASHEFVRAPNPQTGNLEALEYFFLETLRTRASTEESGYICLWCLDSLCLFQCLDSTCCYLGVYAREPIQYALPRQLPELYRGSFLFFFFVLNVPQANNPSAQGCHIVI